MQCTPTIIPDVLLLQPQIHPDPRGVFLEKYNTDDFAAMGITDIFNQDNLSISKKNVLRGLHFQQAPFEQTKIVSVISGAVFDVAVDIRPSSPTFGKWVGVMLDDVQQQMLYIPKGFAHGFYVLSEEARFFYKCAGRYQKEASKGILWNDPEIGIQWPLSTPEPLLSFQDTQLPLLRSLASHYEK